MTTITQRATITILLNTNGLSDHYQHGDTLHQAHSFWSGLPACGDIRRLLTNVWAQLGGGAPRADWAVEYARKGYRSLRVGDVIVIGETAHAVDVDGFRAVSVSADQIAPAVVDQVS